MSDNYFTVINSPPNMISPVS